MTPKSHTFQKISNIQKSQKCKKNHIFFSLKNPNFFLKIFFYQKFNFKNPLRFSILGRSRFFFKNPDSFEKIIFCQKRKKEMIFS